MKNSLTTLVSETHTVSTFYYLFYFEPVKHAFNFLGLELIRNQGWFWEPGVLSLFKYSIIFRGIIFKKKKSTLFLIVIAIFSTYSTTGILIMLILLFFMFKSTFRRNPIMAILLISLILPVYFI